MFIYTIYTEPSIPPPVITMTNTPVPSPEPLVWKNNEVVIVPPDPMEQQRADERRRREKKRRKAKRVYWRR